MLPNQSPDSFALAFGDRRLPQYQQYISRPTGSKLFRPLQTTFDFNFSYALRNCI